MNDNSILRLENVSKFYKSANNVALGIRKVNVSFKMGEFVLITGASGSGKSTLINVLSGMTSYEEGIMYVNGEDSSYFGNAEYEQFRKDYIACIFQNYNLIDSYSVYENIELALIAKGVKKEARKAVILDIAEKVGIKKRLRNKVTKLSGGEKQRVAIARALVSDAPILVCDEITGNLDHETSLEIVELLHSLSQNKLVLMVTHDPEEVMQYATRIITMNDGAIQSDKVIKEANEPNEVTIKETNPISKMQLFKLALKSFKNTPKKSILLVLILLVATIFIGFACASIDSRNKEASTSSFYSYSSANYDKNRILVRRQDNTTLSQSDYDYFNTISNVKYVYSHDYGPNYMVYGYCNDYTDEFYYSVNAFPLNANMLTEKDLTHGSLPSGAKEVVIQSNETDYELLKKAIGRDMSIMGKDGNIQFDVKITGFIISNDAKSPLIYFNSDAFNFIEQVAMPSVRRVVPDNMYFVSILKASNLANNTIKYYEMNLNTPSSGTTSITYLSNGVDVVIENVNITKDGFSDAASIASILEESGVSGYQYCNLDNIYTVLLMSSDLFDQIASSEYQTSIYANGEKYVNGILDTLIEDGYVAINAYYENTDNELRVLDQVLNIFLYLFCIILTGVIYLLAHLSLKNVIYSERKDLLIMRSLGMKSKQVTSIIYVKLVGVGITTTLLFIIFSIVMHGIYFPTYHILYSISVMGIFGMIYTFVLMFSMTFFLSRKFAKNIFKANIASKDKEESLS